MTGHDWIGRIAALEVRLAATESRLAAAEHRIACLENGYTPTLGQRLSPEQVRAAMKPGGVVPLRQGQALGDVQSPNIVRRTPGPMVDDRDHGPRFAVPDVPVQDARHCSVCGMEFARVNYCGSVACPAR